MINNRQGGRRRGRGGQRTQNLGGRPDGNRQDNRQRGNAAQLLEKYKSMARDAQLSGDRVQTEYYLQFADHYYRVLGESRARFEEQRRQRGEDVDDDENDDELIEAADDGQGGDERDEEQRFERADRRHRGDRPERSDRGDRNDRNRGRRFGRDRDRGDEERANGVERANGSGETIAFDVLPPAIARDGGDGATAPEALDEDEAPRPRRRPRRSPIGGDEGEVAPAA